MCHIVRRGRHAYIFLIASRDTKEEVQKSITRLELQKTALEQNLKLKDDELLRRDLELEQSLARSVRLQKPIPR